MADEEREPPAGAPEEDEGPPSTPFDHPFFLPVVAWLFAGWFAFDIVTGAQAYIDHPNFNRGGLVVTSVLAIWFTWRGIQERRTDREG